MGGVLSVVFNPGDLAGVLPCGQEVVVSRIEKGIAWVSYADNVYTLPASSLCSLYNSWKFKAVWLVFDCVGDPVRALQLWDYLVHPESGQDSCKEFKPWPMFEHLTHREAAKILQHFHKTFSMQKMGANHE